MPTAESVAGKTDGLLRNPMYIGNVLHQNPMYAPNAAQPRADGENENKDLQQKTIVFRLKCEESSDCSEVSSVAVSPCNEIFLADTYNRQVQVFSMKGVYLRRFPTVTSGENSETLKPHDISIDGTGHVWVVGNADRMSGFIVRYTKLGSHLITLRATFSNNSFSGMTVDTLRNLVVATEYWWGYGEVKLLHFNGTVEHKFRVQQGSGYPGLVALGREGNMFVSDSMGDARVHVYNNRSQYLYSFGCDDIDEETDDNEADEVMGICTDGSGNVLLVRSGGAVDMFTEDGRYVRRVVPSRAGGVAVAPGGQLVVTDFDTKSVAGKTDGLLRNPMYIGNVLHQNPMYAPNTAQPRADGGQSCVVSQSCLVGAIIKGLIVATLAVITALIISIYVPAKQGSYMQTTNWMNTSFEVKTPTNVIQYTNYTSPPQPDIKVEAVAVSPGNEIFVADTYNRQVQVFSMKGMYLRRFPTVISGENSETMEPDDISIDGQGHVWVVGYADRMSGIIVRYTKLGSLLTTLRATFSNNSFSGMTVDTLRNLVVATEYWWGYGEVKLLHFNGTVEHKFRVQQGSGYPGVVAVGREGNLFVSDSIGDARVHVYNNRSQYLYSFGCNDIDEGRAEIGLGSTEIVTGICTDGSGNVLLVRSGGAVDMFTEDGRYVRRVVTSRAGGVAVAPGGQLVVTDFDTNNVSIAKQLSISRKDLCLGPLRKREGAAEQPSSSTIGNTFRRYLQKLGIDEGETLHGCRSGCAISLHMAGASDRELMDHVGWFTGRTASHYMKITQVMEPGGPAARIASQEVRQAGKTHEENNELQMYEG
ncbi:PREDICTED: uncharacterized protein LOC109462254 [Branchiostoma belcheri]|uniref:Uncharacterized protein LOC109462254 n=1 Tax=Branchiostoma belcheri TaxID=7741 RepID=A0A6P4XUM6_BRABE|nr:PREDICTED: uncharacterized protein LOC109462254 [Branchiostoma belcheri]